MVAFWKENELYYSSTKAQIAWTLNNLQLIIIKPERKQRKTHRKYKIKIRQNEMTQNRKIERLNEREQDGSMEKEMKSHPSALTASATLHSIRKYALKKKKQHRSIVSLSSALFWIHFAFFESIWEGYFSSLYLSLSLYVCLSLAVFVKSHSTKWYGQRIDEFNTHF